MKLPLLLWKASFFFLIVSGALGVIMRYEFFNSIGNWNYQFILHTHSHIILLGWVFNALIAAFHYILFTDHPSRKQLTLYVLFQVAILGMLFTFPFMGYALYSIVFSTLHIVLSYFWVGMLWRRTYILDTPTGGFLRSAMIYLVISTIGPFALGPIIASGNSGSDWYFMAIYYYLHFLYNGFFIFGILGMFFWYLKEKGIQIDDAKPKLMLKLLNISCVLGLALSALWMKPFILIYIAGAIAGLLQVIVLFTLIGIVKPIHAQLREGISINGMILLKLVLAGFALKIVLQVVSAVPDIADLAYQVRNFVIGYLHLVFLGIITPFLMAWFHSNGFMPLQSTRVTIGLKVYLVGFLATELTIVLQPWLNVAQYFKVLFVLSFALLIAMVLLFPFRTEEDGLRKLESADGN